jgi:hypothetical protein
MSLLPVTSVKYNLTVPSLTCVENLLIQSAALLYDVASDMSVQVIVTAAPTPVSTSNSSANKHHHVVQLTRTVTSRLSQKTYTTTVKGWMSCVRLLKHGASPLIMDAHAPIDISLAQEESWMEAADLTLLTIVREGTSINERTNDSRLKQNDPLRCSHKLYFSFTMFFNLSITTQHQSILLLLNRQNGCNFSRSCH